MCGINGFVSPKYSKEDLLKSRDHLQNRGPDEEGYFYESPVGLGHRRLSIIDLSSGTQPMYNEDSSLVIVFNGEIYNFKKLRAELIKDGHKFHSESDTEVILKAYQTYGLDICLEKLEGMFAFAIWDKRKKKLFIARDRFGEKPLYYLKNSHGFVFASELKALYEYFDQKKLSVTGLNLYFSLTYIPAPYTIYEGVWKLEAGHYLEVDENGNYSNNCYYNLGALVKENQSRQILDYQHAKKMLREQLFASVEERMLADVPLGAFLSGGIDSSIISAIMAKISNEPIKTFSIGFHEKAYDESERAALVATHIGSDHTLHMLGHEDLLAVVDESLAYFDEPFGDSSAIPTMIVAKKAKGKVTVVLTGDCADELFGGYEKYLGNYYTDKWNTIPYFLRRFIETGLNLIPHNNLTNHELRKLKKVVHSASLTAEERYIKLTSLGFSEHEKKYLLVASFNQSQEEKLSHFYHENPELDEMQKTFYSDVKLVLEGDMLTKLDRMCMINSLEGRVPFLDSRIVDISFRLPYEFKIEGKNKKKILKDTFADLLPLKTLHFAKKGFGLPLRLWFKKELKEELLELLDKNFLHNQGIFNAAYIHKLLEEHMGNKENHSVKLWTLFVFQKWFKRQGF
ncbi:MAG TPA: asparagine synthase (glutamine-hydrolyzing) [Chitinophagaceae bacterium]|nr:asparagine synthase (glutamine-hydrolyzing) [Chitinophagaceae bacterium]